LEKVLVLELTLQSISLFWNKSEAHLFEMGVKAKGLGDFESLHDCIRRAIGKAPGFIVVMKKDARRRIVLSESF